MSTAKEAGTHTPPVRKKLGRGLEALLGESRREEPLAVGHLGLQGAQGPVGLVPFVDGDVGLHARDVVERGHGIRGQREAGLVGAVRGAVEEHRDGDPLAKRAMADLARWLARRAAGFAASSVKWEVSAATIPASMLAPSACVATSRLSVPRAAATAVSTGGLVEATAGMLWCSANQ